VVYTGFSNPELKSGDRLQEFHLETPEVLEVRLQDVSANIGARKLIPTPVMSSLRPVCVKGFLYMTGLANGFVYAHTKRVNDGTPTAEDRKVDPDRTREKRSEPSPVKQTAVAWLRALSELATVLPNCHKQFKILPYRSPKVVHAIYVREMELERRCAWVDEEDANYDATGGSKWDSNVLWRSKTKGHHRDQHCPTNTQPNRTGTAIPCLGKKVACRKQRESRASRTFVPSGMRTQ
jgi:hypothetical protein